jgi:hypothetical protein
MRKHRRRSDRSGRAPWFSPGRPPVAGRDERRRFWAVIAAGARKVQRATRMVSPTAYEVGETAGASMAINPGISET